MIALFRGRSLLSRLIRWHTRSPYSHAAWICGDGQCLEAWSGGVRKVESVSEQHKPRTWVEYYAVEGMTPEMRDAAERFLTTQLGRPYDTWGIIGFITRRGRHPNGKWFCSELVFEACRVAGVELLARTEAWEVSPGMLCRSTRLRPVLTSVTEQPAGSERRGSACEALQKGMTMKKLMLVAMVGVALAGSGCASMLNMEMARSERQSRILQSGQFNGMQTVSVNLMELRNITDAPLWRTLLAAGIDIGAGLAIYELGENEGWWSSGDDTSQNKGAVTVNAGRDAVVIVGGGGDNPQAAEVGNAIEGD